MAVKFGPGTAVDVRIGTIALLHWRECGIGRSFGLFYCSGKAAASERTRGSSIIRTSGKIEPFGNQVASRTAF